MLLDVTISEICVGAFALVCPLMMVLMMVGMAVMGGGHGHRMCHPWSHEAHHQEDEAPR